MARCCGGADCGCVIQAGENTGVTGSGTQTDPYIITSAFQSQAALDAHIVNPNGAHAASAISFAPSGGLTSTNVQDAIVEAASIVATGAIPVGTIIPGAWNSAPAGYLLCNGASYTTASQPTLFAAIGYSFGGSAGNFNVPDLRGKVPVGRDATQTEFDVLGESGGVKNITLATTNLPAHTHTNDHDHPAATTGAAGGHSHQIAGGMLLVDNTPGVVAVFSMVGNLLGSTPTYYTGYGLSEAVGDHNHSFDVPPYTGSTGSTGSGTPTSNLQPYQVVNWAVKAS